MSWHHFIDINKSRLLEDLTDLNMNNSEEIWQEFYQKYPYTHLLDVMIQNIQEQFSQEQAVAEYWKFRVRKYLASFQEQDSVYPLAHNTDNLIQAHQLDINYFDGMSTVDTFKLFTQDKMEEYEIRSQMKGGWSDGIEMEVEWINKEPQQTNDILNGVLDSAKETDRLAKLNPLWRLLDEESWIQKQLVKPQVRYI